MRHRLPPLLALQAFEAAARHENFAAAAAELNLSQSAVSHRVRVLERHLGYPLFERLPRGLRLTELAKAYLPALRRAFEEILSSTSGVFGQPGAASVTLRAPITYSALWLPQVIDDFLRLYPHIRLRLASSIWADKLAAGEADVDIRLGYGRWPGYEATFLLRDRLVAVMRPQVEADLPLDALIKRPVIHIISGEDHWRAFFQQHDLERPPQVGDLQVDSTIAAAEIAASSDRLALLQERLAGPYLKQDRLVLAHREPMQVEEALYILLEETAERRKPEAILLRDWLLDRRERSEEGTDRKAL